MLPLYWCRFGELNDQSTCDRYASRRNASLGTEMPAARPPAADTCGNDLIIAAQAVTLDLTLVSDNEREFARVAGLRVENWLKD